MRLQIQIIKQKNSVFQTPVKSDSNLDVRHPPFLITIQNKFVVQPPNNNKELTFKNSNEDMLICSTPLNN